MGTETEKKLTRRQFGRGAALALAGLPLAPAAAALMDGQATGAGSGRAAATEEPTATILAEGRAAAGEVGTAVKQATPAGASGEEAEVEAKFLRTLAEYGDRLTPEQKTRLRATIAEHVHMLAAVRAYSLSNADAPATVLRLVTAAEG